jgi:hypothetical protein
MRTEDKQDVRTGSSEPGLPEHSRTVGHRDLLYLFACHVEWSRRRNLGAHQELVAALDDPDRGIRAMAEVMLHRSSPRPQRERRGTIFQL